ncbi:guanylate binding protein [Anaeramoeba flamelloides]|uniref:Guanylate binding protein n=1 Tax=Anaeramoeba flamelloides TaxID=1746091 RepID=A0AAV7YZT4_9EUKA|nr:guanylate binding protein [Anaeramoeba flamelloides]
MNNSEFCSLNIFEENVLNGKKTLKLKKTNLKQIQSFTKPLFSVGIIGSARKGKSTLLNHTIGHLIDEKIDYNNLFPMGNNSQSVTSGMLILNKPISAQKMGLSSSQDLMFLDVQGTDLGEENTTRQLVTIASLFSSVLIINVDKNFKNSTLDLIKNLALLKETLNFSDLKSPHLLFLIRNYSKYECAMTINRKPVSKEEYLKDWMDPEKHPKFADDLKFINKHFPRRSIFTMKKPKTNPKLAFKKLPDFVNFLKNILNNLSPLSFGKMQLKGNDFASLIEKCHTDLKKKKMIQVLDLASFIANKHLDGIIEKCLQDYKNLLKVDCFHNRYNWKRWVKGLNLSQIERLNRNYNSIDRKSQSKIIIKYQKDASILMPTLVRERLSDLKNQMKQKSKIYQKKIKQNYKNQVEKKKREEQEERIQLERERLRKIEQERIRRQKELEKERKRERERKKKLKKQQEEQERQERERERLKEEQRRIERERERVRERERERQRQREREEEEERETRNALIHLYLNSYRRPRYYGRRVYIVRRGFFF